MSSHLFERAAIGHYPTRQAWDAISVDLLATMLDRWSLIPGDVFTDGYAATVLAVTDADGNPAVVKIGYPHHEAIAEAVALDAFPRDIAPRILRVDTWAWAMLLERVVPGTSLAQHQIAVDDAIVAAGSLLARIHSSPIPAEIPRMTDVVSGFVDRARAQLGDARDLDAAIRDARPIIMLALDDAVQLMRDDRPAVLVHGDFNPGNILSSNEAWVAIDPKPMSGDGAYDLWPLVTQLGGAGRTRRDAPELERRMRAAAAIVGVDADRAIRWSRVRAALSICWYLDANDTRRASAEIPGLEAWHVLCRGLE